ncbi:DUF559 domain-containing protein [Methylobacterium sp. Leaf456]|uniref:endonuclease domain-containing protein n=1 Tax=Methylobacterium sp. Leaf456 TaxID=1736382 RepID=UPI00256FEC04|nr:DUF559 domain-containing protein [Methylobacterium sp. Leaf456]
MCAFPDPEAARPSIAAGTLAGRIDGLGPGERLVVFGIGREGLGRLLADGSARGALTVACEAPLTAPALIGRLLDDLAELALDRWPEWHEGGSPSPDPWRKAAAKRAALGHPPRFRRMAREIELARLLGVLGPLGPALVWEVDPAAAQRARPVIEAMEWCARHGAATVAVLPVAPPETAPYDRLLYGALTLARAEPAVLARFIAPAGPHHASTTERRVAAALGRDPELAGLFACNAAVPVGAWGGRARVDLLCSRHRVVVELDGPEHRGEPNFGNDRHRDYELLTAGYLVLRLTNQQVADDLTLCIEKIRAVVRLRRDGQGGER